MNDVCDKCGEVLEIGSWPFCGDHGRPVRSKGFEPYFDIALGRQISTPGDWNQAMRPHWENDHIVKVDDRGKSESYYNELRERREHRIETLRRQR